MKNKYNITPKPTIYNGVQYRSRLESHWAAFFDLIGWNYTYEPFDLNGWSPDFKLDIGSQEFLIEVKPKVFFDNELINKIGKATDYSEGVLVLNESPFWERTDKKQIGICNIIGCTSSNGSADNYDFHSSALSNHGGFLQIVNIGSLGNIEDSFLLSKIMTDEDRYSHMWNLARNAVMFLKPI